MEKPIVFFIGKPGSGKGTQAEMLAKVTGWPVVGTSGVMREIIATGTAAGHKLKQTMDSGDLAPSWIAVYSYLKTLFAIPDDGTVIFDGTSRTPAEAEVVADSLKWLGKPFRIFHLTVPDEEVHGRIALRREKGTRPDDHPEAVAIRLKAYYESTDGAICYLRDQGLLTDIDGHRPIEVIAEEVRSILKLDDN
ncbi:MAG: nucleoside monophosphate kinase [Candidatus Kaiserbacteria bacterium]|nr:nucleoside monophosphate kinase [Candidatus Kaiserbacteria bacterium]